MPQMYAKFRKKPNFFAPAALPGSAREGSGDAAGNEPGNEPGPEAARRSARPGRTSERKSPDGEANPRQNRYLCIMESAEEKIYAALTRWWGFREFRPVQREIILSVMQGRDTLALMPTGGGKSLTYQVPTMARDGLAVVITPLIALMKDQVDRLRARGIPAVAIHSGLSPRQIDIALDNCVYGDVKFLYVAPERLTSELKNVCVLLIK